MFVFLRNFHLEVPFRLKVHIVTQYKYKRNSIVCRGELALCLAFLVAKQGSATLFFQCGTSLKCSGLYSELFPFLWAPVNVRNFAENQSHGFELMFEPCDRHVAKRTCMRVFPLKSDFLFSYFIIRSKLNSKTFYISYQHQRRNMENYRDAWEV